MAKKNGNGKAQKKTAGRVLGPVQVTIGESIDPIYFDCLGITRGCVTNERDESKERTMGSKYRIPYALYRHNFYISAGDADKTGFSEQDLARFKEALVHMLEDDRSASRGEMVVRAVCLFKHESRHGNDFAHKLLARVKVTKKEGVDTPSSFEDYVVTVDRDSLPKGVEFEEVGWSSPVPENGQAVIHNRIEGVLLVDVKNGNPNGDPDADGRPRQCPITGKGIITDVCIKRKIRNYILSRYADEQGMRIFFQEGAVLDNLISKPYETDEATKKAYEAGGPKNAKNAQNLAQKVLCRDFYDIRTFGAVLSTGSEEGEDSAVATDGD